MTMCSLKNERKQTNIKTKKINANNLLKHAVLQASNVILNFLSLETIL